MSSDPNKPIEKLLKASAETRRAEFGADPQMPNPMRARLHDELVRMGREQEKAPRTSWFATWWGPLTLGTAVAAVLISLSLVWRNRGPTAVTQSEQAPPSSVSLADQKPAPAPNAPPLELKQEPGAAGGTQSSPSLTGDSSLADSTGSENKTRLQTFAERSIAPSASATPQQFVAARPRSSAEIDQNLPRSSPSQSSGSLAQNRSNFRQQFSASMSNQSYRAAAKKRVANILSSFQLEQNGEQIRVVDADGSTYTGNIEPQTRNRAPAPAPGSGGGNQNSPTATGTPGLGEETNANEFAFRTYGYNNSLQKSIVFEGNYTQTRAPQRRQQQQRSNDNTPAEQNEQTPARIVGTARINGESSVQVDAVSVQ